MSLTIAELASQIGGLAGKKILVRADFNVPVSAGVITDDGRIKAGLATITELLAADAAVIIVSHRGRPTGENNAEFSLAPVAARLAELLGNSVEFATDTVGESAIAKAADLGPGQVLMLENVRFNPAETSKNAAERNTFAEKLAALADAFVSDGFGVVHREQASVYDIATKLPAAMGNLVAAELKVLAQLTNNPARPYVVVLGGSKVSDKLAVIDNLLAKADTLIIGGGMLFTFLAAQGYAVGNSLLEADQIPTCQKYLAQAEAAGVKLLLPTDIVVAPEFSATAPASVVSATAIPEGQLGLDIGPESAANFAAEIQKAHTVFWNGPMGVFEFANFANGTKAVAKAMTQTAGLTVVGGGDSAAAVRLLGFADAEFGHISTGGGASLEYLEGKDLPGLSILN